MKIKAHWDIMQRTQEWHAVKWGYIGSTDAVKVLKYKAGSFDDIAFDLAKELTENPPEFLDEGYISADMQRGIDMEPEAVEAVREWAQKHDDVWLDVTDCGFVHRTDGLHIGVSPDQISIDLSQAIEVKCLSGREHLKVAHTRELPYKYIGQAIQYFAVCERLEVLYWGSYRPEAIRALTCLKITPEALVNIGTEAKRVDVTMREAAEMMRQQAAAVVKDAHSIVQDITGGTCFKEWKHSDKEINK
jgi:hypothetical protein